MKSATYVLLFFVLAALGLACSKSENPEDKPLIPNELSATPVSLSFTADGGTQNISITSNTAWTITSSEPWCTASRQSSHSNSTITISAKASYKESERSATITISGLDVDPVSISVSQDAFQPAIASYIEPDASGMESDAKTLAAKIHLGWNLVNTLEAIGGETAWGNPKTTNDLIAAVKASGFNAVRIPCSWDQYLIDQEDYRIKESWLQRVKEVVDYCVNNEMYAILNIHWDGGWLENNCTPAKQEELAAKQAIIWKQIAVYFRDYDEHLLFAGANEPNAEDQQQANVLKVYLQTFIDVVRGTGGRNAYRNLIVQAPYTNIDKSVSLQFMPTDQITNRLFAEVHYYSPYQFCLMDEDADWGKMFYFWGAPYHVADAPDRYPNWDCEENYLAAQFLKAKTKFVNVGIPVILGEFGAMQRHLGNQEWQQKHDESRAYFYETIARESKNKGIIPFCWDNSIFDRTNNMVRDSLSYKGLLKGAEEGNYPF
ncbi:cellulase family glycosylhydrolase [Maribellus sediminis]|uniref:cellulase family glycosylhydrolase n=1 Tax=Maribellus sediminis TaxID=2696285 RepID=UPI0014303349|nr:cellulase family glycosylhydrolase [Maribellus sediminis]